ncbi:MAG: hypothetical protein RIS35_867, partial [Pseudomonadota bacterium]
LPVALGLASAAASGLPPLPADTRVESVIDDGAIEGYRVSVIRFRSALPVEELLPKLRSQSRLQPRMNASDLDLERRVGSWRVLSQRDGEGFRTIQVRAAPDGSSEGLHTRWQAVTRIQRAGFDPASLLPPGARLLRRFSASDGRQQGETLVARCDESADRTLAILHERLRAAGFEGGAPPTASPGAGLQPTAGPGGRADSRATFGATGAALGTTNAHPAGVARFYRKPGREIVLTVASHPGQTGLVLHHSEVSP